MDKAKLEKYREERGRYLEKIASYQKRVRALDQKIMEAENLEIRALMRNENITLDDLTALVRQMQERRWSENAHSGASTNGDVTLNEAESGGAASGGSASINAHDAFDNDPPVPAPSQGFDSPYARPAYAATFNDLEDDE